MKVVVTRPLHESATWVTALDGAGHAALCLALMEVRPRADTHALDAAWRQLESYDAVMFVSGNAVRYFFAGKPPQAHVFEACSTIKTRALVTGPGSLRALLREGAQAAWIDAPATDAAQFDSEALWQAMGHRVFAGWRALIVRGTAAAKVHAGEGAEGHGRDWFASKVRSAGGTADFLVAYERHPPAWTPEQRAQALQALSDGAVWLITSSEALGHLQTLCGAAQWQQARAVVTHPRIGEAARAAGFAHIAQARPDLESVLASIESFQ